MHSKKALDQFYPGLIDILPLYYGQADKNNEKYKNVSWTDLNHLDLMKDWLKIFKKLFCEKTKKKGFRYLCLSCK